MLVGWQKRGLIGRRESLAECATSAAMRSSFPPDELHLHVFGQRHQTSCQSAECWLASAQHQRHQYLLLSSCCVAEVVCSIIAGVILSRTSTDTFVRVLHILPIISPLHTQHTFTTPPPLASLLYMHHAKLSPYHAQATPARLVLLQA